MKETEKMADYYLRGIPHDLLCKAKHRAIDEEMTLRLLVLKAIDEYVGPGLPVDGVTEAPAEEAAKC